MKKEAGGKGKEREGCMADLAAGKARNRKKKSASMREVIVEQIEGAGRKSKRRQGQQADCGSSGGLESKAEACQSKA